MKINHQSYYAVIFTSKQTDNISGYIEMAKKMEALAKKQDGFLGIEFARNEIGITISYWRTLDAIKEWKQHTDHLIAQKQGKSQWYDWYHVRICKVEREYDFKSS